MRLVVFLTVIAISAFNLSARISGAVYLDSARPIDERVNDLLDRMTLHEKIGQLLCPMGWEMYSVNDTRSGVNVSDEFRRLVDQSAPGMLWATYRADPWTRRTIADGLNPSLAAMAGNALQRYVIEHTRLGIPLFLAEEAPHGHMAIGTTVFPTGIGMAATFNPQVIEQVGRIIGTEVRAQGAHISYGPVLDLMRDPRWSRVEETMGEDPCLTGSLGAAMVRALGAGNLNDPHATIATLKHFIAYAAPEGGQNGNFATLGRRDLELYFLPPFHDAVNAGRYP